MALLKCPKCKKNVSDRAEACPNCGEPIKSNIKNIIKQEDIVKNTNLVICIAAGFVGVSLILAIIQTIG